MLLYRIAISLFALVQLLKSPRADWPARLGGGAAPKREPHLWWHAASLGELRSSRPVLEAVRAARPDLRIVITANTATALSEAARWRLPGVQVRPAPIDLAWVTARFLRAWSVYGHVTLEAELWPHRLRLCPGPVIVLGARMSARTARGWGRLPRLAARVLGSVTLLSAQDGQSAEGLHRLGLPRPVRAPTVALKAFYVPQTLPPDPMTDAAFDRDTTWLAASTHDGEEGVILDAHAMALRDAPDLTLILAPRHPERGDAVAALARARSMPCRQRSRDEAPERGAIYIADTTGEMDRWYRAAGRVFVGGSLVERGGHTPYEPLAHSCAILHGPSVHNFAEAYAAMAAHVARVTDAQTLAQALHALRGRQAQRDAAAAAARAVPQAHAFEALVARLLATLPPPTKA